MAICFAPCGRSTVTSACWAPETKAASNDSIESAVPTSFISANHPDPTRIRPSARILAQAGQAIGTSEGFDDIVKYHPTHEESPVAPKDAIPRLVTGPVAEISDAVAKKDARAFEQGYDKLTKACNDCHQATNFSFNVVQRPTANPYQPVAEVVSRAARRGMNATETLSHRESLGFLRVSESVARCFAPHRPASTFTTACYPNQVFAPAAK